MKDIEEAWTGGQMKFFAEAVHTTHCEKHSNRRAESEEVTRSEDQLWIADHRHSGATTTNDEIH